MSAGTMERVQLQYRAFEIAQAIMEELAESDDAIDEGVCSLAEAKEAAGERAIEGFGCEVIETECANMTAVQAEQAVEIAKAIVDSLLKAGELKVLRKERKEREAR